MLEGCTTLGHLAAHTSTTRLGLHVTGVTYRHPGLPAKIVTTLDVLSGGRAFLGIRAAWYQREHTGLGVPFPPTGERFERLEETLRVCKQMWDPQVNGPFEGRHYRPAGTLCVPAPVSAPHPAVKVGRYFPVCPLDRARSERPAAAGGSSRPDRPGELRPRLLRSRR